MSESPWSKKMFIHKKFESTKQKEGSLLEKASKTGVLLEKKLRRPLIMNTQFASPLTF